MKTLLLIACLVSLVAAPVRAAPFVPASDEVVVERLPERTDLVAAFLTGVQGVNKPAGVVGSEMLRLNTAIAATPRASQNRLGVLGGDNAGFPNGRRPVDDVVDIELRVAMGVLCTVAGVNTAVGCAPADAPAGTLHYTDGAYLSPLFFADDFPYLRAPLKGSPNDDNAVKLQKTKQSQ